MLNIVVMIKQVPDSSEVEIDPVKMTLNRTKARNVVNASDLNALEYALQIKDKVGATITVISMGPPMADSAIIECMARGADRGILITDRAFAGADTYPTGLTLAATISKIGNVDIIFGGDETTDSSTGHVGPGVAEFLGIDQITYAKTVDYEDGYVVATRELEDGDEIVKVKPPVLVTVLLNSNLPRHQSLRKKIDALRKGVESWGVNELGLKPEWVGLRGSPTIVRSMKTIKEIEHMKKKIDIDHLGDMVKELVDKGLIKAGGSQ
ncbi:electron transfer flavoprotein beta-subunit [Thermoplasma volcanium GSS1]|uniref:Electron transfer flavoprotein beta-subunit n=1 Tax=Thermoplasma volcanium (strain ATCC 51530 / DSM 4299 / JCM 9571 / NBRC 15438 / GSS1) TaxID=273116 RepID=Q978W2_THEVO|nr:electron transfer flavoprotein subunit beta/FixA family protein [Thermoplasma volcanium]BAB60445.1 electron transfer flavoprotein beta-subunit [Thermoplasma volcanium GSS1]